MPTIRLTQRCAIERSKRVRVLESMFDLGEAKESTHKMECHLPIADDFGIGAIIGPSGCGKTTLLRRLYGDSIARHTWSKTRAIVDDFNDTATMREIVSALSSVGFSSPPNWLRPFSVLSTGERFRANIARSLLDAQAHKRVLVIDEFTSTVDRQVAKSCCLALSKAARRASTRLVVASCHYDIVDYLCPDWVYEPHVDSFTERRRVRSPQIKIRIHRASRDSWRIFRHHHYLSQELNSNAKCFVGFYEERPCVFGCITPQVFTGKSRAWHEHRTVTLPDFQGLGAGVRMSSFLGALCRALAFQFMSTTSHPAMIHYRNTHPDEWLSLRQRGFQRGFYSGNRLTAMHRYIGPALQDVDLARRLWSNEEVEHAAKAI